MTAHDLALSLADMEAMISIAQRQNHSGLWQTIDLNGKTIEITPDERRKWIKIVKANRFWTKWELAE